MVERVTPFHICPCQGKDNAPSILHNFRGGGNGECKKRAECFKYQSKLRSILTCRQSFGKISFIFGISIFQEDDGGGMPRIFRATNDPARPNLFELKRMPPVATDARQKVTPTLVLRQIPVKSNRAAAKTDRPSG